jgi:hypothetical protein
MAKTRRKPTRATAPKPKPAPVEVSVEEPARRRSRAALVDPIVAVIASLFVFWTLRPALIFANTTPTGGDLGAHVWGPPFVSSHIFGHGFLAAWSNDWFGGFPAYRFYMPVPALAAALLHVVFPSGVALKLIVAAPLIALPLVAWKFGRAARLPTGGSGILAISSLLFLYTNNNIKFGGSILSTLAGEYGNALALTLALACFAAFAKDLDAGRKGPAAGLLGALAACCHPVGFLLVLVGLVALVGAQLALDPSRMSAALIQLGWTVLLTILLSAFWYLPFFALRAYTNDLNFPRVTSVQTLFFPYPIGVAILVALFFVAGVVDAFLEARVAILGIAIAGVLFAIAAWVAPRGMLWNARLAPPWQLMSVLVAGAGLRATLTWLGNRWPAFTKPKAANVLCIGLAVVVLFGIAWDLAALPGTTKVKETVAGRTATIRSRWIVGPSHVPSLVPIYVSEDFGGYERDPHWPEYQSLIKTMQDLAPRYGCGRLMPEYDPFALYGSVYAEALLPYWTDSCITSLPGLYADSSPTSSEVFVAESALSQNPSLYQGRLPYEALSLTRGVEYLRELGARYYLAHSQQAIAQARATAGLHEVATVGSSVVFVVDDANVVEPLEFEPVVSPGSGTNRSAWQKLALTWFGHADSQAPRLSAGGPNTWQQVTQSAPLQARRVPTAHVSDVQVSDSRIHFHTDTPGVPVLVRVSYFPWWKANGAGGPYRITPNWMVVVPKGNDVTLTQQTTTVEWFAFALTILGMLLAIALALRAHPAVLNRFGRRSHA